MFRDFAKYFSPVKKVPLELEYIMDVEETGKHVLSINKIYPDSKELVSNIEDLLAYNFYEEKERENKKYIFFLKEDDRQTILSLKSLNPENGPNNSLVFDIEPPVLNYLRKKNINETENAKDIKVLTNKLKPEARIHWDEKLGLKTEFGYRDPTNEKDLKTLDQLKTTSDGKFARIGKNFYPIAKISEKGKDLLDKKVVEYGIEGIPEFFVRDLVQIKNDFNAVLVDLAEKIEIIEEPMTPVVTVKKDSQGWLDFEVSYSSKNFILPSELIAEAKENNREYIKADELTWVKLDNKTINRTEEQLDDINFTKIDNVYRIPASEFASLEEFIDAIGGKRVLDEAYNEFIKKLTSFDLNPDFQLTNEFEQILKDQGFVLRPYQRAGIHWLDWLRKNHLHGVLADDMGLGKTIQSLSALRLAYDETGSLQHSLVIAPKSVLYHWQNEINRTGGNFRPFIYHGAGRNKNIFKSNDPYIFITTYETVARDKLDFARIPFLYLVLDEATKIKNPHTQRSKAIKALNARHRLALSGTPVENRPAELWSLFDFLMRGHLGRHETFVNNFEQLILAGDSNMSKKLGRRIKPFLLRRKKEEVEKDLPAKIEIPEWVDLTEEQRNLYAGMQDQIKEIRERLRRGENINYTISILPTITKLKQICNHPALVTNNKEPILGRSDKFDAIIEKIDEVIDNNEKVLIFSQYLGMLSLIEKIIIEKNYSYIRIDGSTNRRQDLIDIFNKGNAKIALLSLLAAGHGINLTAANHIIHADRWWNPAVEDQATDRAHRIGQKKTVFIYHIIVQGTLEEKIDQILKRKRDMADEILSAAISEEKMWTKEELLEILKPLSY